MKIRAYVRVAKGRSGKPQLSMTSKSSSAPLTDSYGNTLPTVSFAVEFNISDAAFVEAQRVIAEIDVEKPAIAATVRQLHASNE